MKKKTNIEGVPAVIDVKGKKQSKFDQAFETGQKDPGLYRFTMLATYGITGFVSLFVAVIMVYLFFRLVAPSSGLVWIMVARLIGVYLLMLGKDKYPFMMWILILFLDVLTLYLLLNLSFAMFTSYVQTFKNMQEMK